MFIPGARPTDALINDYLDPGSLPWDVRGTSLRAAYGAVQWCLADVTGARARMALRIAHTHLSLTLEPAPHTERYQARRSVQYGLLLAAFLRDAPGCDPHLTAVNHDSAWTLLRRQRTEQVPLSAWVAPRVLNVLRPGLREFLPLLPEMRERDYAQMLRLLVKDYAPEPAALRQLVTNARGPEERWGYDVHAALVYSHFPSVDFRGALVALGALKAKVMRDKEEALREGRPWPPPDITVVEASYAEVMALWSQSRFTRTKRNARLNSTVPAKLAADLVSVLRGADGGDVTLPGPFLNAWFNAERIAQNHAHLDKVWRFMSGSSIDETLDGHIARPVDREALIALLKYLKVHKTEVHAHGSLRRLFRHLPAGDGGVLNAFIGVLEVRPDLGLLAAVLRSELPLDPRGIDLTCVTLIYQLRRIVAQPWTTQPVVVDRLRFPAVSGAATNNIARVEWDWVAKLLAHRNAPTSLPFSLPTAEFEEMAFSPAESEHYGGMIRAVGRKDRLDERVDSTRRVLADVIERTAEVLARREGKSAEDVKSDLDQARSVVEEYCKEAQGLKEAKEHAADTVVAA